MAVFRRGMCFPRFEIQWKNSYSISKTLLCHSFRNSTLTIIWNNLGLSNYNRMKRKLVLKKKATPVIISKRNYLVPYSKEIPLTLMHLWHLSTDSAIVLGRIFC